MFKNKPNATTTLTIILILNYFFGYCTSQLYEGSECELKDGSLGICKSFVLCRWAIQGLNQRVITYSNLIRCSFEGANEIICCGDERPTTSERPDKDSLPIGTGDDEIYFDPVTPSHVPIKTSTNHPPLVTSTTTRATSIITQTSRSSNHVTTQRAIMATSPSRSDKNKAQRTEPKPTIHSFWSEWAPTNDVDIFSTPTTNSIYEATIPTQNTTNSKIVMAPWLKDILNEAIASQNISTTTQSSFENVFQFGVGFNDVDNEINGESNNDLSFSRQKTTRPPSRNTPSPVTRPSRPPPRLGQRRSEIACENYTSLSSPLLSFNILGGSPTALGEFPHMAALGFLSQEFGGNEYDFNCGGSIISEYYILTAAHCVTDRNLPSIIRSGKITLISNDEGVPGVNSTIAEIIPHPNYQPSRRYDDIALIRVSSPIPFGDYIRPACLRSNMSDIDPDVQLIVLGWGRTSVDRAQRSNDLLKTNLTGVPLESCNASLLGYNANDRSLRNGVNLGQICAYDPQARQDSCEGDSGGPLQTYSPNGMSTIVGVTSFGISCGSALPSVYARVAFYLDWIESIVWPNR